MRRTLLRPRYGESHASNASMRKHSPYIGRFICISYLFRIEDRLYLVSRLPAVSEFIVDVQKQNVFEDRPGLELEMADIGVVEVTAP